MSTPLYQDQIITLSRDKSAAGRLEQPDKTATLDNPLCGDRVTFDVNLNGDTITELTHHIRGCALCKASASLLAKEGRGKSRQDFEIAVKNLENYLKNNEELPDNWQSLNVFAAVKEHKSRFDCVLLPFKTVLEALS